VVEPDHGNIWGTEQSNTILWIEDVLPLSMCEQVHCHAKANNVTYLPSAPPFSLINVLVPLDCARH
jgi:hypothetical protein